MILWCVSLFNMNQYIHGREIYPLKKKITGTQNSPLTIGITKRWSFHCKVWIFLPTKKLVIKTNSVVFAAWYQKCPGTRAPRTSTNCIYHMNTIQGNSNKYLQKIPTDVGMSVFNLPIIYFATGSISGPDPPTSWNPPGWQSSTGRHLGWCVFFF